MDTNLVPEESRVDTQPQHSKFTKGCFEWAESLITAVVIVVVVLTFVFRMVTVDGQSMMNTLHHKDRLVVSSFFYKPKPGDIVAISRGQYLNEPLIKRVIAVGGQSLAINFDTGDVTVDGEVLHEPYIKDPTVKKEGGVIPSVVPEGYVFVMGDNRNNSIDSRSPIVGLIKNEYLIGKAIFILFPFSRFGLIG